MIELKENDLYFAKVNPNAIIPTKEKENAGYDIYACFNKDFLVIPPHSTKLVPTGIASAISDKYYLGVAERGSTGKIGMKYSAGVIDSGYRGEIFIGLSNINDIPIVISKLTREELEENYGKIGYGETIYMTEEEYEDLIYLEDYEEYNNLTCIIYPYSKAIAQLIVHEVHNEVEPKEISYEELQSIPSKRGTGSLGSSGK